MNKLANKEKLLEIIKHKLQANKEFYKNKKNDKYESKINKIKAEERYLAMIDILEEIEYQEYKEEVLEDYASTFTYNYLK